MKPNLLLLGAQGHCRSILDALDQDAYGKIALCDQGAAKGSSVNGFLVAGDDNDLQNLHNAGYTHAFVAFGTRGSAQRRKTLFSTLRAIGYTIPSIVDKTAILAKSAILSPGVFVGKGAILNAACRVEEGCIINSAAIVEHDCVISAFAHIAPGAMLAGNVYVGAGAHIGIGSVVVEGVSIAEGATLGAGAVAVEDIPAHCTAVGVPAKPLKK